MTDPRTDAELVTAHLQGDRSALAGMYDRFSAGLYDTAAAMLRDRHEAADATQDVFLIAAERLGQLREPDRLKPWLYAVLRNEVYRRSRRRGRTVPTDFSALGAPELAAPVAPDAEGEMVAVGQLAELVRGAACGLDERDQLVLELSVRQGLQGADLAAALGVTPEQSYTLVHRMRDRVDRSLGALAVAKAGRKDCPALADVLRGWDGTFNVLIRKRVARHIEQCETCERTRRKVAPLALLGAAPAFAAPPELRDIVLRTAAARGSAPERSYDFTADGGFPRPPRSTRVSVVVAGAAAAILLGMGGGALLASTIGDAPGVASPTSAAVTTTGAPTTLAAPTSSTTAITSTTATVATTNPPPPGALELAVTTLDLGRDTTSAAFDIANSGGQPLDWSLSGAPAPFSVDAVGGTLQPGQRRAVVVALDRGPLAEGDLQRTLTVSGAGRDVPVALLAKVERTPSVAIVRGPPATQLACQWTNPRVFASFTDESPTTSPVVLSWAGPVNGTNAMKEDGSGGAVGEMPFTPVAGTYDYAVAVTDVRGNVGTVAGQFTVLSC